MEDAFREPSELEAVDHGRKSWSIPWPMAGLIAVLAVYWSFETVAVSWKFGSVSHGLRVSMVWFLAAVPIGFTLMTFRLLQSLHRDVSDLFAGRPVFEGFRLFD